MAGLLGRTRAGILDPQMSRWWQPWARRSSPTKRLATEIVTFTLALVGLVALLWVLWRLIARPNERPHAHALGDTVMSREGFDQRCGEARALPYVVTFVYSPAKAPWIEPAAGEFMRSCPNTQLRLVALDDIEATKAIVSGELEPTVWAPTDSLMLELLDARWQQRRSEHELAITRGPSLVRTPMVLLIWKDRLELLDELLPNGAEGPGAWAWSACAGLDKRETGEGLERAAMVPANWVDLWREAWSSPTQMPAQPSVAELEAWGRVRVAHASPSRSTIGLLGMYLIAQDYLRASEGADGTLRFAELDAAQLGAAIVDEREPLRSWLRRCEAGQAAPLTDAHLLTETMFNLGDPTLGERGFDAVLTTEQLAFAMLARVDAHEAALRPTRIVYPRTSLLLDHPTASFRSSDPQVLAAGERFVAYLRETQAQTRALELGFRPIAANSSLYEHDLGPNPFTRLRRHGVELELELEQPPRASGDALASLIEIWAEATGRN